MGRFFFINLFTKYFGNFFFTYVGLMSVGLLSVGFLSVGLLSVGL